MSTEGWIFMIGFRVLDVGLLVVWLVWFFRLRDDDDSDGGGGGPGGGGHEPEPRGGPGGGGGLALPLGRWSPAGRRLRDHGKPRHQLPRRGAEPLPAPSPTRIRRPVTPTPVHRRVS
jgi:hypothetical protein